MTTPAASPSPTAPDVERLLAALAGVVAARVVMARDGRLEEVHVISDPAFHPKQVVRNVESALSAGLGLNIDRRIVSVAQVDPAEMAERMAAASGAQPDPGAIDLNAFRRAATPPEPPPEAVEPPDRRLIYTGFEAEADHTRAVRCAATLVRDTDRYVGTGEGPATAQGRCEAGARAVFAAIAEAEGDGTLVLEGVTTLQANGRELVLVAAHALEGRSAIPLAGVAPLERSPEEAAILAALQATNRWTTRGDP
ncbi:MAG: hypothetical protein ACRELV_10070 [Longimicrobiales bacterium]